MTGYRFDLALLGEGMLETETVELDGIPSVGHFLRVKRGTGEVDAVIVKITWFHAPGALSKSGLLTLSYRLTAP